MNISEHAPAGAPRRSRWLPHPLMSLMLGASWLLLSNSLAPVHLISAAALGWGLPLLLRPLLGPALRVHWPTLWRLSFIVLWDIVVSNVTVARLVLGPMRRLRPAWVPVALATDHDMVNALLATIITTTPGTVSCTIDEKRGEILVHALDCENPVAMAADIKARYEAPLMQIFGVHPQPEGDKA